MLMRFMFILIFNQFLLIYANEELLSYALLMRNELG